MTQPPSASADGVWRHLRLAPGLAQPTQPVADGAPAAMVVQQGVLRWLGPTSAMVIVRSFFVAILTPSR